MILFIGSDHVIQQPSSDFQKDTLFLTADSAIAAQYACASNAAGVINVYQLDMDGSADFRSVTALEALKFMGASFVHQ